MSADAAAGTGVRAVVEVLAKALADAPDEVRVTETQHQKVTLIELYVSPRDIARRDVHLDERHLLVLRLGDADGVGAIGQRPGQHLDDGAHTRRGVVAGLGTHLASAAATGVAAGG